MGLPSATVDRSSRRIASSSADRQSPAKLQSPIILADPPPIPMSVFADDRSNGGRPISRYQRDACLHLRTVTHSSYVKFSRENLRFVSFFRTLACNLDCIRLQDRPQSIERFEPGRQGQTRRKAATQSLRSKPVFDSGVADGIEELEWIREYALYASV